MNEVCNFWERTSGENLTGLHALIYTLFLVAIWFVGWRIYTCFRSKGDFSRRF